MKTKLRKAVGKRMGFLAVEGRGPQGKAYPVHQSSKPMLQSQFLSFADSNESVLFPLYRRLAMA